MNPQAHRHIHTHTHTHTHTHCSWQSRRCHWESFSQVEVEYVRSESLDHIQLKSATSHSVFVCDFAKTLHWSEKSKNLCPSNLRPLHPAGDPELHTVFLQVLFIPTVSAPMLEQLLFKISPPSLGWGEVGPVNRGMRQFCGLSKTRPSIGCLGNHFNRFLISQSNGLPWQCSG